MTFSWLTTRSKALTISSLVVCLLASLVFAETGPESGTLQRSHTVPSRIANPSNGQGLSVSREPHTVRLASSSVQVRANACPPKACGLPALGCVGVVAGQSQRHCGAIAALRSGGRAPPFSLV